MLNTATLLFARQPLAYARGSVPHPFGAGPRGHPVRERMRNYLWRSLLTNANYEERIPFAQGHGVPRVAPSNKGRIGFVCPKRYCATRQPTSTRRCLTAGSPAAPTRKDAARHGRSAGWPSHSARRSRDSDPSSADRPAQVAFARCASSRSRTGKALVPSAFSFNGGTFEIGRAYV